MLITGRCSDCGSKVVVLDDEDRLTWNDTAVQRSRQQGGSQGSSRRLTELVTTSTFRSAMERGDIEAHCPNPKCRREYPMTDVVSQLRQARRNGKTSTKLRHTAR